VCGVPEASGLPVAGLLQQCEVTMSEKFSVAIDYDITNGNAEKAWIVLSGEIVVDGVKMTFSNFRAPLDGGVKFDEAD